MTNEIKDRIRQFEKFTKEIHIYVVSGPSEDLDGADCFYVQERLHDILSNIVSSGDLLEPTSVRRFLEETIELKKGELEVYKNGMV